MADFKIGDRVEYKGSPRNLQGIIVAVLPRPCRAPFNWAWNYYAKEETAYQMRVTTSGWRGATHIYPVAGSLTLKEATDEQ